MASVSSNCISRVAMFYTPYARWHALKDAFENKRASQEEASALRCVTHYIPRFLSLPCVCLPNSYPSAYPLRPPNSTQLQHKAIVMVSFSLGTKKSTGKPVPSPLSSLSPPPFPSSTSSPPANSPADDNGSLLMSFDDVSVVAAGSARPASSPPRMPLSQRPSPYDFLGANDSAVDEEAMTHPRISHSPQQQQHQRQNEEHTDHLSHAFAEIGSGGSGESSYVFSTTNGVSPRLLTTQRVAYALNSPSTYTTRFTPSSTKSSASSFSSPSISSSSRSFFQISGGPMELAVSQPTIQNVALLHRMALIHKRKLCEEVEVRAEAACAALSASMREREEKEGGGGGAGGEGGREGGMANFGMTAPKAAWRETEGGGEGHLGKSLGGHFLQQQHRQHQHHQQQQQILRRQGSSISSSRSSSSRSSEEDAAPSHSHRPGALAGGRGGGGGTKPGVYEKKLSWALVDGPPTPSNHTQDPVPGKGGIEVREGGKVGGILSPEEPGSGWEMSKEPSLDMAVFRREGEKGREEVGGKKQQKKDEDDEDGGEGGHLFPKVEAGNGVMALSSLDEEGEDEDEDEDEDGGEGNRQSAPAKQPSLTTSTPPSSSSSAFSSLGPSSLPSSSSSTSPSSSSSPTPAPDPGVASRASVARRKRLSLDLRPDDIKNVQSQANVQAIAAQRYYAAEKAEKERNVKAAAADGGGVTGAGMEGGMVEGLVEKEELREAGLNSEVSRQGEGGGRGWNGEREGGMRGNTDRWNIRSGRIDVEGLFKISSSGIVFANDERHHHSPLVNREGGNQFIELMELGAGNGGAVFKVGRGGEG